MWTFFRFGAQASHHNSFPCPGAQVLAHRLLWLWHMGLVALRHVGSPQTRDRTHFPCVGRWILNHWITREVPPSLLKAFLESFFSYPENPHDANVWCGERAQGASQEGCCSSLLRESVMSTPSAPKVGWLKPWLCFVGFPHPAVLEQAYNAKDNKWFHLLFMSVLHVPSLNKEVFPG